ncbi:MAG: SirB2 family protein [Pseudomonadota bacterium]|nr:SirB2 family protein [Pseudomonadota bacterium]
MLYYLLKSIHITSVIVSGSLFTLRSVRKIKQQEWRPGKWMRIIPHVIDTFLLLSGVSLALLLRQYPFRNAWLTAKVFGLVLYILAGKLTLQASGSKKLRQVSFSLAAALFLYIIGVAITQNPWSFFAPIIE